MWEGPLNGGSSPILGYRVTRATPQLTTQEVLIANTHSSSAYYLDTTGEILEEYSYQVAAISELGIGAYSNYGYWPTQLIPDGGIYVTGEDFVILAGEDGTLIIGDL